MIVFKRAWGFVVSSSAFWTDCDQLFEVGAQDVEEYRLLVRIIVIEESLRNATGIRDRVHGRSDVAQFREQLSRTMQDKLTFVVVVLGAGSSHIILFRFSARLALLRFPI